MIPKINTEGIKGLPELNFPLDIYVDLMRKAEEDVIKNVLKQLFNREIVPEDGKRVERVFLSGQHHWYNLVVDKVMVGRIMYNYGGSFNSNNRTGFTHSLGVEFVPADDFKKA